MGSSISRDWHQPRPRLDRAQRSGCEISTSHLDHVDGSNVQSALRTRHHHCVLPLLLKYFTTCWATTKTHVDRPSTADDDIQTAFAFHSEPCLKLRSATQNRLRILHCPHHLAHEYKYSLDQLSSVARAPRSPSISEITTRHQTPKYPIIFTFTIPFDLQPQLLQSDRT